MESSAPAGRLSDAVEHLERLLDLLMPALPDADDGDGRERLRAQAERYRRALARRDVPALRVSGEALLAACRGACETHAHLRAARRAEMADLFSVFRDMAITVTGESTALTADMATAAARFAALGSIGDLRLLKERLACEAAHLKDTARGRESKWQAMLDGFRHQVALLEAELVAARQEASLDPLTGIANRGLFDRRLKDLAAGGHGFALVLVDVDNFKRTNDEFGHEAGDAVLQVIAGALSASVRGDDIVARIGGDEFAVILHNVTLTQAAARAAAWVAPITAAVSNAGHPAASISCGVAVLSPGDSAHSLLKRADEALYESKRRGPGKVTEILAPVIHDVPHA